MFKEKYYAMTMIFSEEAKKLLVQYTKLRDDLVSQQVNLLKIGHHAVKQETMVTETREFIKLNLQPFYEIMQRINIEAETEQIDK